MVSNLLNFADCESTRVQWILATWTVSGVYIQIEFNEGSGLLLLGSLYNNYNDVILYTFDNKSWLLRVVKVAVVANRPAVS